MSEKQGMPQGYGNTAYQSHPPPPHGPAAQTPMVPPPYNSHPPSYPGQEPPRRERGPAPPRPPPPQPPVGANETHQIVKTEVTRKYQPTSCVRSTTPRLPRGLALTFCIMNCIIPGWGTIGSAFASCCYEQYEDDEHPPCCPKCNSCCGTFCFGFLQFLTAPAFLLGWVWSVIWGLELLKASSYGTTTTTTTTIVSSAARQEEYVSAFPTAHIDEKQRQLPPGQA